MTFDEDAFLEHLNRRKYGQAPILVRHVRYCLNSGATTADAVGDVFPHLSARTRSTYRNALRRYEEFQGATA
jgi:hypothetical protein